MPHIHQGSGQHDITVSAYIIDERAAEPRLWLHRHKKLHKWLQYGGHVELRETPWQALCHEIIEESGFAMEQLQILQPELRMKTTRQAVLHPVPCVVNTHQFADSQHFHTDLTFAFVTKEIPSGKVAAGESANSKLFSVAELRKLDNNDIPANVRDICNFLVKGIYGQWQPVATDSFQR